MNVEPNTKTTLLLNRHHMPFSFCTARAAYRHLVNGRIKGMDVNGNIVSYDGADVDSFPSEKSSLSWEDNTVGLFPNHPYLRSAPNPVTGEETRRFVPTVAICTHHFGYHNKRGDSISLKTLFSVYKGVCQYCLNKIHFSDATKDHLFPKSKGGSNHDFNLVLACKKCNNEKDDIFPYHDVDGKEVKPVKVSAWHSLIPDEKDIRDEWKPYFGME